MKLFFQPFSLPSKPSSISKWPLDTDCYSMCQLLLTDLSRIEDEFVERECQPHSTPSSSTKGENDKFLDDDISIPVQVD